MVKLSSFLSHFPRMPASEIKFKFGLAFRLARVIEHFQYTKHCSVTLRQALHFLTRVGIDLSTLDRHLRLLTQTEQTLKLRHQILRDSNTAVTLYTLDWCRKLMTTYVYILKSQGLIRQNADPLADMCANSGMTQYLPTIRERLALDTVDRFVMNNLRRAVLAQLISVKLCCPIDSALSLYRIRGFYPACSLSGVNETLSRLMLTGITAEQIMKHPVLITLDAASVFDEDLVRRIIAQSSCDTAGVEARESTLLTADCAPIISESTSSNYLSFSENAPPNSLCTGSLSESTPSSDSLSMESFSERTTSSSFSTGSSPERTSSSDSHNTGSLIPVDKLSSPERTSSSDSPSMESLAPLKVGMKWRLVDIDRVVQRHGIRINCMAYRQFRVKLARLGPALLHSHLLYMKKEPQLWVHRHSDKFYRFLMNFHRTRLRLEYIKQMEKLYGNHYTTQSDYDRVQLLTYDLSACMQSLKQRSLGRRKSIARLSNTLIYLISDQLDISPEDASRQLRRHPRCHRANFDTVLNTIGELKKSGLSTELLARDVCVCIYPSWLVLECLHEVRTSSQPELATCPEDRLLQMVLLFMERRFHFNGEAVLAQRHFRYTRSSDDEVTDVDDCAKVTETLFSAMMQEARLPELT